MHTKKKSCVHIGGTEGHPGEQTYNDTVYIKRYNDRYKLLFCFNVSNYKNCSDIGT